MEASFWHERWEQNQIGFHNNAANPLLLNHLDKLALKEGSCIFLPLCGKTLDFGYLIDLGFKTIGIELSEIAVQDLFEQLKLTPTISDTNNFTLYQADNIDIYVGDFFDLSANELTDVTAIYDRAAFIALPDEMRARYSNHLTAIAPSIQQLLVTLEYDQSVISGPPFSISTDEIKKHYKAKYSIELLEYNDIEGGLKGKVAATESAWLLNTRTNI